MKYTDLEQVEPTIWGMIKSQFAQEKSIKELSFNDLKYQSITGGMFVDTTKTKGGALFQALYYKTVFYFTYTQIRDNPSETIWNAPIVRIVMPDFQKYMNNFYTDILETETMDDLESVIISLATVAEYGSQDQNMSDVPDPAVPMVSITPYTAELVVVANNDVVNNNVDTWKENLLSALKLIDLQDIDPETFDQAKVNLENVETAEQQVKSVQQRLFTGKLETINNDLKEILKSLANVRKPLQENIRTYIKNAKEIAINLAKDKYDTEVGASIFAIDIYNLLEKSIYRKQKTKVKNKAMQDVIDAQIAIVKERESIFDAVIKATATIKDYFTDINYQNLIIKYITRGEGVESIVERMTTESEVIKAKQKLKEQALQSKASPAPQSPVPQSIFNPSQSVTPETARPLRQEPETTSNVAPIVQVNADISLNNVIALFNCVIAEQNEKLQGTGVQLQALSLIDNDILTFQVRIAK